MGDELPDAVVDGSNMMDGPKITDEQIAAARQAFRNGQWYSTFNRTPDDLSIRAMLSAAEKARRQEP